MSYKIVRDSVPEPDPFRLKYRNALIEVVGETVRQRLPAEIDALKKLSEALVPEGDMDRFIQLALRELNSLHEGNIARFRLRPSEFRNWTGR